MLALVARTARLFSGGSAEASSLVITEMSSDVWGRTSQCRRSGRWRRRGVPATGPWLSLLQVSGHPRHQVQDGVKLRDEELQGVLDYPRQLWQSDGEPWGTRDIGGERGETVPQVPDEGASMGYDVGGDQTFEDPHRPQPLFEVAMIALQAVVQVLHERCSTSGSAVLSAGG